MRLRAVLCGLLAHALACTGEVDATIGLLEPIRVLAGNFAPGSLDEADNGPRVTSIESASGLVLVGERDRLLVGRTSEDAYAVGVRFAELGTGWWTVPVQDLDPAYPGERDFQFRFDVGGSIPPGNHVLSLAAIDADGRRGELTELSVCVRDALLPDNFNVCDPDAMPPALVIALEWDLDVDLDLVVDTPSGKRISVRRDANAGCEIDGRNAEAVVWLEPPSETGTYLVQADLFDACGNSGAQLRAVVYRRRQHDNGNWSLQETARVDAMVFDIQASGGAPNPLYLMAVEVPE